MVVGTLLFISCFVACSWKHMLPEGPVVSVEEHHAIWASNEEAKVTYRGEPRGDVPILPLLPFGLAYDLDIVLVSEHPDWNMHEYARLATPHGPVWLAKDAREPRLEQSIVAAIPDIHQWWPEVPVRRKSDDVVVTDRSTEQWLEVEIGYENIDGEPVLMTYEGPMPTARQSKRNGSTMGHSRDSLIAVLDLSHRNFGKRASMTINGEDVKIHKLLGLVPMQMVLQQVQGGLGIGEYDLTTRDGRLVSVHRMLEGSPIEQTWEIDAGQQELIVRQSSEMRTLSYSFRRRGPALELYRMQAYQWGRDQSTFEIHFSPSLPDPRFAFEDTASSRFVIDVNGQPGHAVGVVEVASLPDGAELRVRPTAPWWVTDRPMNSHIRFTGDSGVHVRIERVEYSE